MKDGYEREINYARISLCDKCNLYCQYCRTNDETCTNHHLSLEHVKHIIDALDVLSFHKVRLTGGEPLLCADIVKIVSYANSKTSINDIGITTNGILLDEYVDDLIAAGLKRVNISLDTLDRKKYQSITGFDYLERVMNNINLCKQNGLTVKVNIVLLKGVNEDEVEQFLQYGRDHHVQIRFIELMPIGDNLNFYKGKGQDLLAFFDGIDITQTNKIYGDVTRYYVYDGAYEFGMISAISNHFCDKCNRIRFTSNGMLRLCLHSDEEIDLKPFLSNSKDIAKIIKQNIVNKPLKHGLSEKNIAKKSMSKIGG